MTYTKNSSGFTKSEEALEDILKLPIRAIPSRKLKVETCEHFGVRVRLLEDNATISSIYFPYTKNKELVGFKKKDLTIPKKERYHFSYIGEVNAECDLFGMNVAPSGGKKSLCFEGELDALSGWQVCHENYPAAQIASVSIGGTSWVKKQLSNNLEFFKTFKEKIFCFDNDEATEEEQKKGVKKGKEALKDASRIIPDILQVKLSEKDANDMLKEGKGKDLYWALMTPSPYIPTSMIKGSVGLEKLKKPLRIGTYIPCLPKTMEMLRGFREGEMTIILAPSGTGKTTICKEIGYHLNKAGDSIFHIFLEEDLEKTQQSYIALENNVMLPALRENPNILSEAAWEKSHQALIENGRTLWLNHFGSLKPDVLMEDIRWASAHGYKYIILDHISMVFSGMDTNNERKEIDLLLTELAAFTKGSNIHPIIVSHIKRLNIPPPKDKMGNIKYPYWDYVSLDSARGSGAFEQISWNLLAIEGEHLESGERGRVRLRVLKNREWNRLGVSDTLIMNQSTGRMINAENLNNSF